MKTLRLGLLALGACALTATAQDDSFAAGMKSVGGASGELRKMEKKTGPGAVTAAEKIAGVYENMIGFWRQRNAADAVKASEAGKAAAVELASAANAGDAQKAAAAFDALGGTCKSCHEAHRERLADGKYSVK
jgi:cytochrome c556